MTDPRPWISRVFGYGFDPEPIGFADGLALPDPPLPVRAPRRRPSGSRRSYQGASIARDSWPSATSAGPNTEINGARVRMRDRSRDLVRNSSLGARAMTVLKTSLVGNGIYPSLDTGNDALNEFLLAEFRNWGLDCDASGRHTPVGLQSLAVGSMLESGECLLRRRWRRPEDGLRIPMQIQVLEPDFIADNLLETTPAKNGRQWQYGIELDMLGRRTAYRLYQTHPGETASMFSLKTVEVPASEISHIYHATRPGQLRGVPYVACVMADMRDLDKLEYIELTRQQMQACLGAVVTDTGTDEAINAETEEDDDGRIFESLYPGMVRKIKPGEEITFLSPQQFGGFADSVKHYLHVISTGINVPYEVLTGDLSGVNFASIRTGYLQYRRTLVALTHEVVIPHVCAPIWRWMVEALILSGRMPPATEAELQAAFNPTWHPPRWIAIDRQGEIKADVLEIQAGLLSLAQAAAERGGDWNETIKALAKEKKLSEELGLFLAGFTTTSPSQSVTVPDDKTG